MRLVCSVSVKPAATPLLTLLLGSALAVPASAQDLPPDFDDGAEVQGGESKSVELGEDVYSGDDQDDNDDDSPGDTPTVDDFHRDLSPYGQWVSTPEYGTVWVPHNRAPGWRPYSYGEWTYTRHGWTFVSYDPWGAVPFHYGRWVFRASLGWCWIPGYEWSPAWVSWRYGGGYVAWAPLGPAGLRASYYTAPSLWIAVQGDHFRRPLIRRNFVPTARVGVVFHNTREYRSARQGPASDYVARITRRPVQRVHVVRRARPYRRSGSVTVTRRPDGEREIRVKKGKTVRVERRGGHHRSRKR